MGEQELFLEWVDNTIGTYEDAPSEVKNGTICVSVSMLKELKELVDQLIEQNEQLKHRIPRSIEDELRRRIEQLEQGYKDILSWGSLGSTYSDISAAFTFQDIARKTLAGGES